MSQFNNPWGSGSSSLDGWFKNPWGKGGAFQDKLLNPKNSLDLTKDLTPFLSTDEHAGYFYATDGFLLGRLGTRSEVWVVADENKEIVRGFIHMINENKLPAGTSKEDAIKKIIAVSNDQDMTNEELNLRAFMTLIRNAENFQAGIPLPYNTLFGGGTFSDYSKHPNQPITKWGYTSTACGAYAITKGAWDDVNSRLVKKGFLSAALLDYSPESQDQAAVAIMKDLGGYDDAINANLDAAFTTLGGSHWASLPGGEQQAVTSNVAHNIFKEALGEILSGQSTIASPPGSLVKLL